MNNQPIPGKSAAVASMVCGIVSVALWFFGLTSILSLILGIVGLVLANNAKKAGYNGGPAHCRVRALAGRHGLRRADLRRLCGMRRFDRNGEQRGRGGSPGHNVRRLMSAICCPTSTSFTVPFPSTVC